MPQRRLTTVAATAALAFAALGFTAAPAAALNFVFDGTIDTIYDGNDEPIASTVDHYRLTVLAPGTVTVDTRSWEIDEEDRFDSDGNFAENVDVNGDGEIAFIDPFIYLFADPNGDGVVAESDLLAFNDEDFTNSTYGDGSI